MQTHQLKRNIANRKARQVGRGGKRGKTSGRGTKGQKARAGRKMRPEIRDVLMRLPKLRGYAFKSRHDTIVPISLSLLEKHFASGDAVTTAVLLEKKIISTHSGVAPTVKILSDGALTKKLAVSGIAVSGAAKGKIEKAGGTVSV